MLDENHSVAGEVAPDPKKKRLRLDKRRVDCAKAPKHSRHIAKIANTPSDPEQAENEATLIADGILAFEWLAEDPCRSMIGQDWVDFTHKLGWTRGHRSEVAKLVRTELVHRCNESAEETRARLTIHTEGVYKEARQSGDYGPAVSALRLQWERLLPEEKTEKHLHVHAFVSRLPPVAKTVEAWTVDAEKVLPAPPSPK